jgi:hypothetical protein
MSDNEIIAAFMGVQVYQTWAEMDAVPIEKLGIWSLSEKLDYDQSWNSLMPVVVRIGEINITPPPNYKGYRIEIVTNGYVRISGFPMPTITTNVSFEGSLLSATHKAVVEFIKFYNQQKS